MRGYRMLVVLAVACALGAAVLSLRTIQAYVGQVKVIAAATNLSPDQVISPNDLRWASYPKGALYADTVLSPAQAEGYVVRGFVPAGTVLRRSMLEQGSVATIPGKLALLSRDGTDYFAVALPENIFTMVGGHLRAGEHVDIYLTDGASLAGNALVLSGVPVTADQNSNAQQGIVVAVNGRERGAILPHLAQTGNKASLVLVLRKGA